MTIAFRYFPYLVQQQVMDQMDLFDIFTIYSISKKGQILAKSYFNRHNFELRYFVCQEEIWIHRDRPPRDYCCYSDDVHIKPEDGIKVYKKWSFSGSHTTPFSYSEGISKPRQRMLNLVKELFPRLHIYLKFDYFDLAGFLYTMSFVRSFKVPIKRVYAGVHARVNTKFVRAVMTQCSDVKDLKIGCSCYGSFRYDFSSHAPFKFNFFELQCSTWGTKDQLTLFLSCKKIIINAVMGVHYTDQEITEICEKWLAAPETQYLEIQKIEIFSEGIGKLPGAVPLREVTADYPSSDNQMKLDPGKGYMMKKADRTPAIVYHDRSSIVFRTDFKNAVVGGAL